MMCVDIETVKNFLRVDHSSEDELITQMIEASTQLVETRLRRPVIGKEANALATSIDTVPKAVQLATCVIVAFMYENRMATAEELRSRVLCQSLLDQYIDWEG